MSSLLSCLYSSFVQALEVSQEMLQALKSRPSCSDCLEHFFALNAEELFSFIISKVLIAAIDLPSRLSHSTALSSTL
jgi:hypothetical protein